MGPKKNQMLPFPSNMANNKLITTRLSLLKHSLYLGDPMLQINEKVTWQWIGNDKYSVIQDPSHNLKDPLTQKTTL